MLSQSSPSGMKELHCLIRVCRVAKWNFGFNHSSGVPNRVGLLQEKFLQNVQDQISCIFSTARTEPRKGVNNCILGGNPLTKNFCNKYTNIR